MLERIEDFFRSLISSLQIARLYTPKHPRFDKFVEESYEKLKSILGEKEDLVIGIIGEELAFEKEIFFDLSQGVKSTIIYLKERGIEKIVFHRGVSKDELTKFILFLIMHKEELKCAPQDYLSITGVRNITIGKIQAPSDSLQKDTAFATSRHIYDNSLNAASESLSKILNKETVDYLNLRFALSNVAEKITGQYQKLLLMVNVKRYDLGTFVHSLDTSVLAMYFSSRLGFSKDDILDIGVAALFHDIGKLYISSNIIKKPDKLTEGEFKEVKNHVLLGAEILLEYVDTLGILPVVVCFEHHLRYNLQGYPHLDFPYAPHTASMIVTICDVYDAFCQRRNYKNDYPPDIIYNLMIKGKGEFFEPELLDRFFKIMGVWPIGTIVTLSDGRTAMVIDENEDDIFAPKVKIIIPKEDKQIIDLKEMGQSLKIDKFINPWKEGKDLLKDANEY